MSSETDTSSRVRRVLCSNLKRTCRLSFFIKKHPPCHKFAMANYMTDFGNEQNSPRSSRVMRRHRIDRPNVMASKASDEAFLLTGCIKKCAVQGRATSDRIPHSLIFKRMQIKRIADHVRA